MSGVWQMPSVAAREPQKKASSFPRKREPMNTGLWLWVPAFAGTTGEARGKPQHAAR
jgi:hypothetical protein